MSGVGSPMDPDWKTSLAASERYDNIQKIKASIEAAEARHVPPGPHDAVSVESEAYNASSSREQYDAACLVSFPIAEELPALHGEHEHNPHEPGIDIGQYKDCHYVASGVTAEVYRSKDRALKVIVEYRNLEPHNPIREESILKTLQKPCIPLLESFRDQEQRFVLVFPYMPLTLATVLERGALSKLQRKRIFIDIFSALAHIHSQGIIHRDLKPVAILLESENGPAYLSDFGTAWHPQMSLVTEPADKKILDIGTGPYRAPEVLFGNNSYGPPVDMWGAGTMLAECCRDPPKPLFDSREAHEDGNQLGLILSIFKTIGSPTKETWPEALRFKTPPFDMYRAFETHPWDEVLPDVDPSCRDLIASLVKYDSSRVTSEQALQHKCLVQDEAKPIPIRSVESSSH